jgi:hypothetical protein
MVLFLLTREAIFLTQTLPFRDFGAAAGQRLFYLSYGLYFGIGHCTRVPRQNDDRL